MTEDAYKGDPSNPLSLNYYGYVKGNPIRYVDPTGNWEEDPITDLSNFCAGMGDALSFGMTYHIREYMGTNGVVDFDSSGYELGEFAAFAWGYAMQGAQQFDAANSYNSQLKTTIVKSAYKDSNGRIVWPDNEGFVTKETKTLKPGTLVDRYGEDVGSYVSPKGTKYGKRALFPASKQDPYKIFRVNKSVDVDAGKVTPWFLEKGGGMQYKFRYSIKTLIETGVLEDLNK